MFKMTYNKAKDGHVKHSQRINKISLSLEQAMKCTQIAGKMRNDSNRRKRRRKK